MFSQLKWELPLGDIADSVHPHPTLSETLMEAAEVFYGTATHTLDGAQRIRRSRTKHELHR